MGLGTFIHKYKILLKPNSQPFGLAPRPKVKAELQCMEDFGVISHVNERTPWCAAMVVVPKLQE